MSDFIPSRINFQSVSASSLSFRTFLLKVHRDCNLNCNYCYVYNMADRSWQEKPKVMSEAIINSLAKRIQEHIQQHQLTNIDILFHGGEPLLGGIDYLVYIKNVIKESLPKSVQANFGMQTNGVLLSKKVLDILMREQISFGISFDGPKEINDKNRLFHNGKSSYEYVTTALNLISSHPSHQLFTGLLTVIDVNYPPEKIIEYFASIGTKRLDLLLPHGTWDNLPPSMEHPLDGKYGEWLIRAFDSWFDHFPTIRIRFFAYILKLFLGGVNSVETLGLAQKSIVVVETDGAIEGLDTLRSVKEGQTNIGLNVLSDSFDAALQHPAVFSRFLGDSVLSEKCQLCVYKNVCGGGYLPHRYSNVNGYINPSVYCQDLFYLYQHIFNRLVNEVKQHRRTQNAC